MRVRAGLGRHRLPNATLSQKLLLQHGARNLRSGLRAILCFPFIGTSSFLLADLVSIICVFLPLQDHGQCSCSTGYTGEDCSKVITPRVTYYTPVFDPWRSEGISAFNSRSVSLSMRLIFWKIILPSVYCQLLKITSECCSQICALLQPGSHGPQFGDL